MPQVSRKIAASLLVPCGGCRNWSKKPQITLRFLKNCHPTVWMVDLAAREVQQTNPKTVNTVSRFFRHAWVPVIHVDHAVHTCHMYSLGCLGQCLTTGVLNARLCWPFHGGNIDLAEFRGFVPEGRGRERQL